VVGRSGRHAGNLANAAVASDCRDLTTSPAGDERPGTRTAAPGDGAADDAFCLTSYPEPAVGIEPTTARLRIGCSTTELRWRTVEVNRRTCPGADSNRDAFRHHPLKMACLPISPPGQNNREPGSGNRNRFHWAGRRISSLFPLPSSLLRTGLTGLEPATSGVTDRHSNQAELQPQYSTRTYTCLTTTPAFHVFCTLPSGPSA
jgi:hypothetical protein